MATGRWRRSPASTSGATASISPAIVDDAARAAALLGRLSPSRPRRARVTEARLVERARRWTKAATRALVTRSNPGQPPQVYLADARRPAHRLDRGEQARRDPSLCALSRRPCRSRPSARSAAADGTELHYRMLVAAARAGPALSGLRPGLWRARHGRQVTRAWGSPLQQYLVQHGWIVFSLDNRGSPDRGHAFEDRHLSRHGRRSRSQDQLAGVALAAAAALRRSARHRGQRLVLWRLYDAEAARGGARHLRRGRRRRAGHPLGALRHPLYRTLSRQSRASIPRPIARSDALRRCRPDRRSAAADPRHGGRQCRLREFDRADGARCRGAASRSR